ncbi:hypothetical protein CEXT_361541 [Caerostris extrusa]|uniref:Uncharacterized protein n=1 Tax=Caerostris extrusa TaxID=172846 RepID=A0AAV4WFM5_CAEEX|nr:hypothetical protein CEXT_361541 [Caerostris extrusa]
MPMGTRSHRNDAWVSDSRKAARGRWRRDCFDVPRKHGIKTLRSGNWKPSSTDDPFLVDNQLEEDLPPDGFNLDLFLLSVITWWTFEKSSITSIKSIHFENSCYDNINSDMCITL